MTIQSFIEHYGYFAVFVGCFLEGETVLVLAGFAAHLGYLSLPGVIVTAALAGFCGDQTAFELGRRYGRQMFARWPVLARAKPRVDALVERYGRWAAFGVRFLVGMRIAGPVAMGASGMSLLRFAPPNALGALVWALCIGIAGYVFGTAFTRVLAHARRYEEWAFAGLAVAGVVIGVVLHLRSRRSAPPAA